jgi:hypothetical protein
VSSLRDSFSLPTLPGTYVPGYHTPPLRGWILVVVFVPPFSQKSGSHALSKFRFLRVALIAALKALLHPKTRRPESLSLVGL